MKAVTSIDHVAGTARIEITLESIEDAGEAVNVVVGVGRALFPDVEFVFPPSDDEPDAEASTAAKGQRKRPDFSKPPKEGTVSARVLDAVKRLGTSEMVAIADECDLTNPATHLVLRNLRRGGHIK